MDFGDLANARGNREAREEAAAHAQQTQAGLNQIQISLNEQHSAQEREKHLASGLFQITSELDEDLRVITDEPTEEAAIRIANRYLRDPIDAFIDHNNHSALEYKELATKTKDAYQQLRENDWFKWAEGSVLSQINHEETQESAKRQFLEDARREESKKSAALLMKWTVGAILVFLFLVWRFCVWIYAKRMETDYDNSSW